MDDLIISIFCELDNFCKEYYAYLTHSLISCDEKKSYLEPSRFMSLSEIMTIFVSFHLLGYHNFKRYYTDFVQKHCQKFFTKLVSYNRFVEFMPYTAIPLTLFVQVQGAEKCTSISFINSTTLDICYSHRITQHKVFQGTAQRGKSSI